MRLTSKIISKEVVRVQEIALAIGGNDAKLANGIASYQSELRQWWGLERKTA